MARYSSSSFRGVRTNRSAAHALVSEFRKVMIDLFVFYQRVKRGPLWATTTSEMPPSRLLSKIESKPGRLKLTPWPISVATSWCSRINAHCLFAGGDTAVGDLALFMPFFCNIKTAIEILLTVYAPTIECFHNLLLQMPNFSHSL
jgi:hypothetical protein